MTDKGCDSEVRQVLKARGEQSMGDALVGAGRAGGECDIALADLDVFDDPGEVL